MGGWTLNGSCKSNPKKEKRKCDTQNLMFFIHTIIKHRLIPLSRKNNITKSSGQDIQQR